METTETLKTVSTLGMIRVLLTTWEGVGQANLRIRITDKVCPTANTAKRLHEAAVLETFQDGAYEWLS